MLNEIFILEVLLLLTLCFFLNTINVIMLWYLAGIYLIGLGLFLLLDDADIFVGFLWVIDFGVGLIFFIFILHFSNFLHQKAVLNLSAKFYFFFIFFLFFFYFFFIFLSNPIDSNFNYDLKKSWIFYISWYDYYEFFNNFNITELNLLREIYFFNNSFSFFLINFMLFYGIFASITLTFMIKRVFNFLTFSQLKNLNFLIEINNIFFIRNQNFIKQQNTSTGARVWLKTKNFKI